jgi:histidinol-phosphatase (PHP family)
MAQELGIPLTLGSDAHKPEEVGAEFELGKNLIQKYGKGKIAVFEKRKRRLIEI